MKFNKFKELLFIRWLPPELKDLEKFDVVVGDEKVSGIRFDPDKKQVIICTYKKRR